MGFCFAPRARLFFSTVGARTWDGMTLKTPTQWLQNRKINPICFSTAHTSSLENGRQVTKSRRGSLCAIALYTAFKMTRALSFSFSCLPFSNGNVLSILIATVRGALFPPLYCIVLFAASRCLFLFYGCASSMRASAATLGFSQRMKRN
jgi:hypothetical protein